MATETPELVALKKKLDQTMFMAKIAEQAEDFTDMKEYIFEMIEIKSQMNADFDKPERDLVSVGLRNYIGVL
jgi:hypothetical protein